MAKIDLHVAGRIYNLSCRDGEEDNLIRLAALVDRKCNEATQALGVMAEPRLLFTASLLLADELNAARSTISAVPATDASDVEQRILDMAERVENLCASLEGARAMP